MLGLRGLLGSATGLAHARLELLGTELREELQRSGRLLLAACAGLGFALLALGALAAAIVIAAGEAHRAVAALGVAIFFALLAGYLAWRLRKGLGERRPAFSASLAELERDRELLVQRSQVERAALGQGTAEIMRLVSIGVLAYSIVRRLRR